MDLIKKKDLEIKEIEKSLKLNDDELGEAHKRQFDESNANLINCVEKAKLYEAQIFGKTSMINQKKIEVLKNKEKKIALRKSEEGLDKEINLLQQKLQFEDPTAKLPKALIEEYRKTANSFDLEVYALKKQIGELRSEISEAKGKLHQLEKTQQNCEAEKLNCERELKSAKEREVAEITQRASLEEQTRSLKTQLVEKTKLNAENEIKLKEHKNKQDILLKKLNDYEIYSSENSKRKKINELVNKNSKVLGFFFELIAPIKKQLELPVKVALLKYLGYLVVEDSETARDCAEFLKAKEISADVIVLENIPAKPFDENLRNKIGSLGNLVMDLIDCKRKGIKDAVGYLIKDIVLLHDPTAQNIQAAKQRGFTSIITMDGTLIKKGTITAGNYKNLEQYSFNYMANNLDEFTKLGKELEETESQIKELENKLAKGAFEDMNKLKIKIGENENSSEASNANIKNISETITKLKAEIKDKDHFLKQIAQRQIDEIKENLLAKKMNLTELENREETVRKSFFEEFMRKHNLSSLKEFESFSIEEIKRLTDEAKVLEEKRAKAKLQLKALEAQDEIIEKLEKSLHEDKEKKRVLESEKESLDKTHKETALNFERYKESKNEDYKKVKILKDEVAKVHSDLDKIDRRIRALLKNKVEFEHKISASVENKKNILQESKLNLENFISEMGVNLNSVFISFNANLENHFLGHKEISDKQNCIFDYALIEKKVKYSALDNIDFDSVNEKIANIKIKFCEKIKDLDKYVKIISLIDNESDKLKDKEDELAQKKKEINLLVQSLIAECDLKKKEFEDIKGKRRSLFDEFFERLSQKLSEVYKELTKPLDSAAPGGSVYIYKTNNDEPYLGHVCYLPTPPGKRSIHDIDLLSGGEKTMAILCLLISIQSICATPLLILDEIDAYLDPHHELILERLFKRKCQEFQVIIVTHKSNIFRSAHSLLGTYFNKKKNTSVPISLDMKKLQLDSQ